MSGHSKWSTIKRKKGAADAKRGKLFSKIIKEITISAREGGGDPEVNPRLRSAIQTAKDNNMPNDNIEKAIKRGTGEIEGVSYEEHTYEGYGPGGVAFYLEVMTDNRNRTTSEVRHIFSKNGGSIGEVGCVAWMFDKKGLIVVDDEKVSEDDLFEIALEAGAEDLKNDDGSFEIITTLQDFENVRSVLKEKGVRLSLAEISMIPQSTVPVEDRDAEKVINLFEALEDHDDVQNVYANFDIDDEVLAQMSQA